MGISRLGRLSVVAAVLAAALVGAPAAQAQEPVRAFGEVPCTPMGDVRFCEGSVDTRVDTFDGVPLDVNLTLPSSPASGPYPLIVKLHGYGGSKEGLDSGGVISARNLARGGYAVLSYTARGFGESCGSESSRLADLAGCADGWIRLADSRYEVRDTQYLAGLLVDEGLAEPAIGVTGGSYGGGQSVMLATLRDRIRLASGAYRDWRSPGTAAVDENTAGNGTPMEIAAAVPVIPWTDLAYSLAPNGGTVDYLVTDEDDDLSPIGVLKQSFVAGLFAAGEATGYYAPPLVDPDADLTSWFARVNAGEPYNEDPFARSIIEEISSNHSGYYLRMDREPAPILISNGFTDDLFPVDEAIRYENKVRDRFPNAEIAQFHFDYGHMRGANKAADTAVLRDETRAWFDRYLGGEPADALTGVEVLRQTCPSTASSGAPLSAPTWRQLHPGEVRLRENAGRMLVGPPPDPRAAQVSLAVDPVAAGSNPCVTTPSDDLQGTATYRLPTVDEPYTLVGSPTVIANIDVLPGLGLPLAAARDTQIAARLWDVDPDGGEQTLVSRGLYRPEADGRQVFQLHPNAYRFETGHVPKLELLGGDAPYGRLSNSPFATTIERLDFRLPTNEPPGAAQVDEPADPFVPPGGELAPDYRAADDGEGDGDDPGDDDDGGGPGDGDNGDGRGNGGGGGRGDDGRDGRGGRGGRRGKPNRIVGTPGDDVLRGTPGRDIIIGRGGDDIIIGRGGRDVLRGGRGDDTLRGGRGADKLRGGPGNDTLRGGRGRDDLRGGPGNDKLRGGPGRNDVKD